MAPKKPKKPSPLEVPPAVSSSEEEVSGEESQEQEEELESQEENEEDANTEQNHKIPTKKAASSVEDGSESESDSDHPPRGVADPNVKPVDDASKLKKTASPSVVAVTPTRSASKRRVENRGGDGNDSKRAKKKVPEAASGDAVETTEKENQPKKLFKRVWSEEDEIIILKGMKDFSLKKGTDPITDFDEFSEFIKNSLHIDFTRTQLNDKMRKLKKKYLTNADKMKNGADRTFSKRHWQNVFNLSKEMWGTEANIGVGADAPPKKDIEEEQKSGPSQAALEEYILLNQTITTSGLDAKLIKEGLSLIDSYKKSELEEEWRELQMAEAEMFLRRIEFARKQTKIALDALKKH